MDPLGEDELVAIFEQIYYDKDKKSFSLVCKKFLKVACFRLLTLHSCYPDLLLDMLSTSPKMFIFECHESLSNNHMKVIAQSCPNLYLLNISTDHHGDEFDDVGLCAIAEACIHLGSVDLNGRLHFTENGIGSLVRSCKNLARLNLEDCLDVDDNSLKVIGEATCLKSLCLEGCSLISDLGLQYLANGNLKYCLDTLLLTRCNRITDNGLIHLNTLKCLTFLDLGECGSDITDKGVVSLPHIQNINHLVLNSLISITDKTLIEIGSKCLKMKWLDLSGCKNITSVGLRAFSGHPRLSKLVLFSCYNFSWEDVKSIALTCPELMWLHLSKRIKKAMPKDHYEDCLYKDGYYCEIEWK